MARIAQGSVHGRFQPFHNGHLDYLLQAFEEADFIWVGLTQIFRPDEANEKASGRDTSEANPLTFYQRTRLVEAALTEAGISKERFRVVPFPIEEPSTLREFVPEKITCFTTILHDWNEEKIGRLESEGFPVVVLQTSEFDELRVKPGVEIREMIRGNDARWKRFVPSRVAEILSAELLEAF